MEDVFDAAWQSDTAVRNTPIEAELASLIAIFGLALLDEPDEIRRLLTLACPQSTNDVERLIEALDAGVPQALQRASHEWGPPAGPPASTGQPIDGAPAVGAATTWAARTWARALGLSTSGPDDPSGSSLREPHEPTIAAAATRRAGDAWAPTGAFVRAPRADGTPSDRSSPERVASPGEWPAPRSSGRAPLWEPAHEPVDSASTSGAAHRREPSLGRRADETATANGHAGTTQPDAHVPSSSVEPPFAEPLLVEPLFSDRDLERIARGTPALGSASLRVDPGHAAPLDGPAIGAMTDPAAVPTGADDGRPRFARWAFALAVVSIAAVVGLLFANDGARWLAERNAATLVTAAASRPADRVAKPVGTDAASTAPASRPDATPAPSASDVTQSRPATDDRSPAPAVGAAATPAPAPTVANPAVPAPTLPAPSAGTAGEPAPVIASPAADAKRPAGEGVGPVISRIDVPRVVEGQPFTVVLRVTGAADVVSIERRTVDRHGAWPGRGDVQKVGVQRSGSGALLVPFHAMDAPASATIAFTLVGRDGSHSESKSAIVSVAGNAIASAGSETPAPCTAATCGTVVESRELEYDAGTGSPIYRVVVHLDDREVVASTALYRLQLGTRVRMQNGHFVPTGTQAF